MKAAIGPTEQPYSQFGGGGAEDLLFHVCTAGLFHLIKWAATTVIKAIYAIIEFFGFKVSILTSKRTDLYSWFYFCSMITGKHHYRNMLLYQPLFLAVCGLQQYFCILSCYVAFCSLMNRLTSLLHNHSPSGDTKMVTCYVACYPCVCVFLCLDTVCKLSCLLYVPH